MAICGRTAAPSRSGLGCGRGKPQPAATCCNLLQPALEEQQIAEKSESKLDSTATSIICDEARRYTVLNTFSSYNMKQP
jgi:hypothetical protein